MNKVLVTGIGIVSAIGSDREENHTHLRTGKGGIGKTFFFDSRFAADHPFGEVKISTTELRDQLALADATGYTRTDYLALKAFREAVSDAGLSEKEIALWDTALISSSTVGGMCLTDKAYEDANYHVQSSEFSESYSNGKHILRIVENYGIKGITDCINTACSSSANAILMGCRLIRSGKAKRVIVGGVDSLAKYTANGFNALQILSSEVCMPFDQKRSGLNLGEGAAFLVLESEEVVGNKKVWAEVSGWGNSADAYHPSALSDEATGPKMAIMSALSCAGISGSDIGYVNAHGTATENNDVVELTGIKKALGHLPQFNSTKSYTGHTLGAAGAIEAVFSILALSNNELYPSLNCDSPMPEAEQKMIRRYQNGISLNHVLSNSFGFAGNCSSLIFSKI